MESQVEPRPTWDDVWFSTAEIIAKRSLCSKAQIGCVIVAEDQTVISCSYNGTPPNYRTEGRCSSWCPRFINGDTDLEYSTCKSSHAEANAIVRADWSRTQSATVYTTGATCISCAKLLAAAKVSRVVHAVKEHESHRRPEDVESFLRDCGVIVDRYTKSL